jgi:hypothetical protein
MTVHHSHEDWIQATPLASSGKLWHCVLGVVSFYAALSGLLLLGDVLPRALPWATVVRPFRACLKPQRGDIFIAQGNALGR